MELLKICLFLFIGWNLALSAEIPRFDIYKENSIPKEELTLFVMSEKLDGVRGIWNGEILQTRKGNKIQAPKFWLINFPPFVLDGELWLTHQRFDEISSIVRDLIPNQTEWQNITYQVFDVRGICEECTLRERLKRLEVYLKDFPNAYIKIIPQIPIQSQEHLESYYQEVLKRGGEGIILRKDSSSKIGYKRKPFTDTECVVQGYTPRKR